MDDPGDPPYMHQHSRAELDSHADTTAVGDGCLILRDTGKTVNVGGFDKDIGTLTDIKVVTSALAYDCPTDSTTFVLIFHESLHVPNMEGHLICPYQMRA